ncbi:1,4-dihydroxy-2-naphthoate polyprenyltransferase [Persicobacter sp. CCB-QB2]|uniref:1,4-dihydroxy-2-naphthoate polyprenyltransferase n=1 Tax=Persicobacter sp. CCB-QB2 TaxID=1561025 RepID=UPI00209CEE20|nr:1,4-dihydroxy-2-naphthoate polyprenyltransferase [Persicobacter sp. CCB-QB2]
MKENDMVLGKGAKIKAWITASRLRTLPLAFSSIFMGSFIAAYYGHMRWSVLGLATLTTLFLQVLSNLANDYGDSVHGADSDQRQGPQRVVQQGLISLPQMKRGMIICGLLSLLSGIALLYVSFGAQLELFLAFLLLGLFAIGAAVTYTAGVRPYGYMGLGDISVFLFFGPVGVLGVYFLHSGNLAPGIWLPAAALGFFSAGVLNVNNIRDIESDREAGKYSIPVRLGRKKAVVYHALLLLAGWAAILVYSMSIIDKKSVWIILLMLPLFLKNFWAVKNRTHPSDLDPFLKQLAISTFLFVLVYGFGLLVPF